MPAVRHLDDWATESTRPGVIVEAAFIHYTYYVCVCEMWMHVVDARPLFPFAELA